jgi:hypothetical protein
LLKIGEVFPRGLRASCFREGGEGGFTEGEERKKIYCIYVSWALWPVTGVKHDVNEECGMGIEIHRSTMLRRANHKCPMNIAISYMR